MLIDDEDQRRQDHNARLFLLLASLTELLLSLIQPSSRLYQASNSYSSPSRSLLTDFLATLIALPCCFLPTPYLHINGTVPLIFAHIRVLKI